MRVNMRRVGYKGTMIQLRNEKKDLTMITNTNFELNINHLDTSNCYSGVHVICYQHYISPILTHIHIFTQVLKFKKEITKKKLQNF